jgi:hypothetical protein
VIIATAKAVRAIVVQLFIETPERRSVARRGSSSEQWRYCTA